MKEFIIPSITLLVIDYIYLYFSSNYFKTLILSIQKDIMKPKILPILLCYLFLIFSLYYFIIKPKRNVLDAFILGICMYGMYETLNYALFDKWSILPVFFDTIWGGSLFAITTFITYKLLKKDKYI